MSEARPARLHAVHPGGEQLNSNWDRAQTLVIQLDGLVWPARCLQAFALRTASLAPGFGSRALRSAAAWAARIDDDGVQLPALHGLSEDRLRFAAQDFVARSLSPAALPSSLTRRFRRVIGFTTLPRFCTEQLDLPLDLLIGTEAVVAEGRFRGRLRVPESLRSLENAELALNDAALEGWFAPDVFSRRLSLCHGKRFAFRSPCPSLLV